MLSLAGLVNSMCWSFFLLFDDLIAVCGTFQRECLFSVGGCLCGGKDMDDVSTQSCLTARIFLLVAGYSHCPRRPYCASHACMGLSEALHWRNVLSLLPLKILTCPPFLARDMSFPLCVETVMSPVASLIVLQKLMTLKSLDPLRATSCRRRLQQKRHRLHDIPTHSLPVKQCHRPLPGPRGLQPLKSGITYFSFYPTGLQRASLGAHRMDCCSFPTLYSLIPVWTRNGCDLFFGGCVFCLCPFLKLVCVIRVAWVPTSERAHYLPNQDV